jgi:hypothetical protein
MLCIRGSLSGVDEQRRAVDEHGAAGRGSSSAGVHDCHRDGDPARDRAAYVGGMS